MKRLRFLGKIEDLKSKRFIRADRGYYGIGCWQKGIGGGITLLIYPDGRIEGEINGFFFPGIGYLEKPLQDMKIPFEEYYDEEDDFFEPPVMEDNDVIDEEVEFE